MDTNGFSPTIGRRVAALEARSKELAGKLQEAQQKATYPLSAAWGEAQTLVDALDAAADQVDARLRLRAALRRIVEGVWLLVVRRGWVRLCALQIWFKGGERHRDYLIYHRPDLGRGKNRESGCTWTKSFADVVKPGSLDLRDREHARRLEAVLMGVELPAS
jgi:hypothetical protein